MSELCWKCIEAWKEIDGICEQFPPWLHCHHKPEEKPEKPKCWCDAPLHLRSADTWIPDNWYSWKVKFCPVCGKKLED